MAGIGVHKLLHHLGLFCIEVAEVTVDDSGQCIVWHLLGDDIDTHLAVIVFQNLAESVFYLLLCVFWQ